MTTRRSWKGMLSGLLAASFLLSPVLSVRAKTVPEETTACTEITETAGTTLPTEPQETTAETTLPEQIMAEPPETTAETTQPEAPQPEIITIEKAASLPVKTENITIQGTVVFASANQVVLQDDTGSIRLAFEADPEVAPGEILQVTGLRSGGLYVEAFEVLGTGPLPFETATLQEIPNHLRVCIQSAEVGSGSLGQNGASRVMKTSQPVTAGITADVYGVLLDGVFYADTIVPTEETVVQVQTADGSQWNLYFGWLHAHSQISNGEDTVEDLFQAAAAVEGLDFFAVTDLGDSIESDFEVKLDNGETKTVNQWQQGRAAAEAVTDGSFVGIYGYEMSWPIALAIGHINIYGTDSWVNWYEENIRSMSSFSAALKEEPEVIGQFNHPDPDRFGNFFSFTDYRPEYDSQMHLIETGTGEKAYDYYNKALDQGWHLAPSHDTPLPHQTLRDGLPAARTVVLAEALTQESLFDAIRSYRVYTTQDSDLRIGYTLNGSIMGSSIAAEGTLEVQAFIEDPTDGGISRVDVVSDGGAILKTEQISGSGDTVTMKVPGGHRYYYIKVTQSDGDTAVTAPVWVEDFGDVGIERFTASADSYVQGEEINLTLTLFNRENTEFTLESVRIYRNEAVVFGLEDPGTVGTLGTWSRNIPLVWPDPGEVTLRAEVTGTVAGMSRTRTAELTLHIRSEQWEACTIAEARAGTFGASYRVKGYVTAGNWNPDNAFENTLYLQDDTGGIAVTGYLSPTIQVGAPMEVTGVLRKSGGNFSLELTDFSLLKEDYYRYTPRTMANATAMDYDAHGGELLQVEGQVVSLTKTADGRGISRLTLQDLRGDMATILIEDNIRSSTFGTNELAETIKSGRTVRAMGLLHIDEYGTTVLRVRNCDEVVYVPSTPDPSNPKTGDWLLLRK